MNIKDRLFDFVRSFVPGADVPTTSIPAARSGTVQVGSGQQAAVIAPATGTMLVLPGLRLRSWSELLRLRLPGVGAALVSEMGQVVMADGLRIPLRFVAQGSGRDYVFFVAAARWSTDDATLKYDPLAVLRSLEPIGSLRLELTSLRPTLFPIPWLRMAYIVQPEGSAHAALQAALGGQVSLHLGSILWSYGDDDARR